MVRENVVVVKENRKRSVLSTGEKFVLSYLAFIFLSVMILRGLFGLA